MGSSRNYSSMIFVLQAIIEDEVTQRFSAEGKICITYLLMSYFIVNKAQYFFYSVMTS